ncbi:MAG: guanylate kinase [Candidatus Liberibacter psyllaurous]
MSHIFVLMGKAGVGKTSIAKRVVEESYNLTYPLGTTTRKPRPGEKDNVDYEFLTEEAFKRYEDTNVLLENVTYKGNKYGYLRHVIVSHIDQGKDLLVILTPEGYEAFKAYFNDQPNVKVTPIAIYPASEEERLENLKKRGSESSEDDEIDVSEYKEWFVYNDDLDKSVRTLKIIIEEVRKA